METLLFFLGLTISSVCGQFQVTSVNGRPVSQSGSAFASGSNVFTTNFGNPIVPSVAPNNFAAPLSSPSQFSITNVNGRPVDNTGAVLNTNRIRVEVELVRFENPKSLMFDGQFCDTASKCDPRFNVDLDVNTPLARWPGSKPLSAFQNMFEASNTDMLDINRVVWRDTCAGTTNANLRVQIVDVDDVTQPDLIDEYECVFDIGRVQSNAANAVWSPIGDCRSRLGRMPPQTRLLFRHREYAVANNGVFLPGGC